MMMMMMVMMMITMMRNACDYDVEVFEKEDYAGDDADAKDGGCCDRC